MSDQTVPAAVDFVDIDPETAAAANAAMNRSSLLTPPEDATTTTDKKNNVYERWTEGAVIEAAWRESTDTGLLATVVQVKFRAGGKNQHAKFWFRHMLNPRLLTNTASEEEKKKHSFMNDKSIFALTSLFTATNNAPASGGLKASLLSFAFPPKGQPGAKSPLVGKTVMVNLCNQPNSGKGAKTDRQSQAESYLPGA